MKWLVVILLLLNVVYFGFELDRETRMIVKNRSEVLHVPAGVKKLVLVRELGSEPPPRKRPESSMLMGTTGEDIAPDDPGYPGSQEQSTDVMIEETFVYELLAQMPDISVPGIPDSPGAFNKPPEPQILCFSYGPFPDDQQLGELMTWFEKRQVALQQRAEGKTVNNLFWIYLAPQDSRDSAIEAIEELKKQGIQDFRLIETGDLQNAISLGLFSTQSAVNRRLNELKKSGYQPVVVPYRDADAIAWLDIKLIDQKNVLNEMFTGFPARFNSVPVNCSEIALL